MASSKRSTSSKLIPTDTFTVCLADNLTLSDICALYTRKDVHPDRERPIAYRLDKLVHHLRVVHKMTLVEYCRRFGVYDWPKCPVKGTDVGYKIDGKGVHLSTYAQGVIDTSSPANQAHYKRMSKVRKGRGNPMYGKAAWNTGLTAETDERLAKMGEKVSNRPITEEQREHGRQTMKRLLAERGPLHTTPHSEKTKELARRNTTRLWAEGVFKRTSSLQIKMREFLATLPLKAILREEYSVTYFSMDFAFPHHKIAIEVQGSYYHVDPRMYPNGPTNAMQRRNWGRDKAKRTFCCDQQGWTIIEVWEPEMNDGSFKEPLICKLKQYGLLD